MDKRLGLFLGASALLVGSFFGSYYAKHPFDSSKGPLFRARQLLETAAGDNAKLERASDLLTQELTYNPDNLSAIFLQGRTLQQRGLLDPALQSYEKFLNQKASLEYAAHFNAAELYEVKGELQKAEGHFQGCIAAAPQETAAWERLIALMLKQNRKEDASSYFRGLLKIAPASEVVKRLSATITPVPAK